MPVRRAVWGCEGGLGLVWGVGAGVPQNAPVEQNLTGGLICETILFMAGRACQEGNHMTTTNQYHPEATEANGFTDRTVFHECQTCGQWVLNNDTTTSCRAKDIAKHRKYQKQEAKIRAIRQRMEEREQRFKEAQRNDEWEIHAINYERTYGFKPDRRN